MRRLAKEIRFVTGTEEIDSIRFPIVKISQKTTYKIFFDESDFSFLVTSRWFLWFFKDIKSFPSYSEAIEFVDRCIQYDNDEYYSSFREYPKTYF